MLFPESIEAALNVYYQSVSQFLFSDLRRMLFGYHPSINELLSLPDDQKNDLEINVTIFINNTPSLTDPAYQVLLAVINLFPDNIASSLNNLLQTELFNHENVRWVLDNAHHKHSIAEAFKHLSEATILNQIYLDSLMRYPTLKCVNHFAEALKFLYKAGILCAENEQALIEFPIPEQVNSFALVLRHLHDGGILNPRNVTMLMEYHGAEHMDCFARGLNAFHKHVPLTQDTFETLLDYPYPIHVDSFAKVIERLSAYGIKTSENIQKLIDYPHTEHMRQFARATDNFLRADKAEWHFQLLLDYPHAEYLYSFSKILWELDSRHILSRENFQRLLDYPYPKQLKSIVKLCYVGYSFFDTAFRTTTIFQAILHYPHPEYIEGIILGIKAVELHSTTATFNENAERVLNYPHSAHVESFAKGLCHLVDAGILDDVHINILLDYPYPKYVGFFSKAIARLHNHEISHTPNYFHILRSYPHPYIIDKLADFLVFLHEVGMVNLENWQNLIRDLSPEQIQYYVLVMEIFYKSPSRRLFTLGNIQAMLNYPVEHLNTFVYSLKYIAQVERNQLRMARSELQALVDQPRLQRLLGYSHPECLPIYTIADISLDFHPGLKTEDNIQRLMNYPYPKSIDVFSQMMTYLHITGILTQRNVESIIEYSHTKSIVTLCEGMRMLFHIDPEINKLDDISFNELIQKTNSPFDLVIQRWLPIENQLTRDRGMRNHSTNYSVSLCYLVLLSLIYLDRNQYHQEKWVEPQQQLLQTLPWKVVQYIGEFLVPKGFPMRIMDETTLANKLVTFFPHANIDELALPAKEEEEKEELKIIDEDLYYPCHNEQRPRIPQINIY